MLDQGLKCLEVLRIETLLNLGDEGWVEGTLEHIHIDWLVDCVQDVHTSLQSLLSQGFRELEWDVFQHYRKYCLTVGCETLLKILRNLIDNLESSKFSLEGTGVHGEFLLTFKALEFKIEGNSTIIILGSRIICGSQFDINFQLGILEQLWEYLLDVGMEVIFQEIPDLWEGLFDWLDLRIFTG